MRGVFTDPFASVDTQPVQVAGKEVDKIAVRVQDDSGEYQVAGLLGKDYNLIQNSLAYDIAKNIFTRSGLEWETLTHRGQVGKIHNDEGSQKIYFDGRKYLHYFITKNPITAIENGGEHKLHLGALLRNSYDGSGAFGMELYMLNIKCKNCYYSRNRFGFFIVKHVAGQEFDIKDGVQQLTDGAQRAIAVAPKIEALQNTQLTPQAIFEAKANVNVPQSKWGSVLDVLAVDRATMFGLYQAMTHVVSHEMAGINAVNVGSEITDYILK